MDAKLAKVILWPKNPLNKRREVKFEPVGVNVVTGWSQKGKSALIHIIDYCLGSDRCAIPVGAIRDSVSWFGVLLHVRNGQILLARRNPEHEGESPEMVIRTGRKISLPDEPSNPEGRDAVVRQLNVLAKLPPQAIAATESNFDGPPSFRDLAAFQFQPQHIIANPYTLFFKADTMEHREKLIRSVLPYVLGAVDSETLEKRAKLRLLEADLRLKREQLEQARRASLMWLGRLQSFYATARDNNLLPNAMEPEANWSPEIYVSLLSKIPEHLRDNPLPEMQTGSTRRAVREMTAIRNEYERLLRTKEDKRRKLSKLSLVSSSASHYSQALDKQSERLLPVGWFAERIRESHECPLCGSDTDQGKQQIEKLAVAAKEVASTLATVATRSSSFETEILQLEKELGELETNIQQVEIRLNSAEERSVQVKEARNRRDFIHGFVGELKAALEGIRAGSDVSLLAKEEKALARDVMELQNKVNEAGIRERMRSSLASISSKISHYAQLMHVEHSNRHWELDERNLTLRTAGANQRSTHLWEIGSAANWMGFHVATLLALHEHFRSVLHNPVPKFLILDQPSQAFFPEGLSGPRIDRIQGKQSKNLSDDLARLKLVFRALSEAVDRTSKGLQIIVLEHADATVWKGIPNVHQVQEWRDQDALVPLEWKPLAAA
jgi:hypothetical protein